MAYPNLFGCEAGDLSEIASTAGTVSASTTFKFTGGYSLLHNPTAAPSLANFGTFAANGTHTALSHTTLYGSCFFYMDTAPGSGSVPLFALYTAIDRGGTELLTIQYNATQGSWDAGSSSSFTHVGEANIDEWYFLEWRWVSGGATAVRLRRLSTGASLDWVSVTGGTGTAAYFSTGHSASSNETYVMYVDDVVTSDAELVAPGRVLRAVPTGAGTNAQWTNGTGATFAEVDEVPHDSDTTYLMETGVSGTHDLALENSSTIGMPAAGVIKAVKIMATVRNVAAGAGSIALTNFSNGSQVTETAWTTGSTSYLTLQRIRGQANGSTDWTQTLFDGLQVGVVNNNANDARCTAIYAMALFVIPVSLAGNQPASTGTLAQKRLVSLAGNQPTATGTLSAGPENVNLAGNQPNATGALAADIIFRLISLAGSQPNATGALAADIVFRQIALAGNQPTATGTIAGAILQFVNLAGNQPNATGALIAAWANKFLEGTQPTATGALTQFIRHLVALAGDQPAASGALASAQLERDYTPSPGFPVTAHSVPGIPGQGNVRPQLRPGGGSVQPQLRPGRGSVRMLP